MNFMKTLPSSRLFLFFLLIGPFTQIEAQWVRSLGTDRQIVETIVAKGSVLFAGAEHGSYLDSMYVGGALRSTDNGVSWQQINDGFANGAILPIGVHTLLVVGENLFAGTTNGVFTSSNNGTSWTSVSSGLDSNSYTMNVRTLLTRGSNLFAGTAAGIFISTDNGANWAPSDKGLTAKNVQCLIGSDSVIFAGTWNGGAFSSTNNGANWNQIYLTSSWEVGSFALIGSELFVGRPEGGGVLVTTDMGKSWSRVSSGLIDTVNHFFLYVTSLAVAGQNLFAGTQFYGVYMSTDLGANWKAINYGLSTPFRDVWSVFVDDLYAFVGTDNGIWRRPILEILMPAQDWQSHLPNDYLLFQNYPNPFNSSTIISYQLPTKAFVTLEMFDMLGRSVVRLIAENQNPGCHSVRFEAIDLSSGIYFCHLTANSYSAMRKVLLLK